MRLCLGLELGLWFRYFVSVYIAWRIYKEDPQFAGLRRFSVAFAALGGTNFHRSDLTAADFSGAQLKGARFTGATLTRTCFRGAKGLAFARAGKTLLREIMVRELLVTGQGAGQSFANLSLRGAYLAHVDLTDADFTHADLSDATLRGAYLEGANFTEALALDTDFTGAHMTGCCLEAWNIDHSTRLENVNSRYVYLLNNQQERRPNSGEFGPGEFSKLFQEMLDTVDLIFTKGIDWRAFMISLNNLKVVSGDAEIQVQSIENKGDGVFVVRLATPPRMDKAAVHGGFMQDYEHQLKLIETTYRARLEAKQEIIDEYKQQNTKMEKIVELLARRPINIRTTAIAGENIAHAGDRNIDVYGNVTDAVLNQGEISREVSISSQERSPILPNQEI
jgi:uncharacterized protein YjbI with pentapeptide repeats